MEKTQSDGINASNQEFRKYEQVIKDQSYSLSEQADTDEFDTEFEIRTCDMSLLDDSSESGQIEFSQQLGSAMQEIGFAIITNHGVDPKLYHQAEEKVIQFFETIPYETRMKYHAKREGSVNQGYFPIKETTIIHPDLVEGWVFCRRAFHLDDQPFNESEFWSEKGYEPFFRTVVQAHEKLIHPLMQGMLRYLGCDPHLYDEKLTKTNFGFRLNYYPELSKDDIKSGGGRMLGHEDVDLFTILPSHKIDGLQVLNRKNMKWIRILPPEGSIIINTGDYMQRISNDIFPSTTHRVSRPIDPVKENKVRTSIPMAIYVWEDEILEVLPGLENPKYKPIKALNFHTKITSKYYGDDYAVGG